MEIKLIVITKKKNQVVIKYIKKKTNVTTIVIIKSVTKGFLSTGLF